MIQLTQIEFYIRKMDRKLILRSMGLQTNAKMLGETKLTMM